MDPENPLAPGDAVVDLKRKEPLIEVHQATDAQRVAYDSWFTEHEERHLRELSDLVAIPTLAMDPERGPDLTRGAEFLRKKLSDLGMQEATVHEGCTFPMVTAEWSGAEGQPTVLFYGHFDVQPADPSRWESDPFEAEVREGRLYGRGASDSKGPIVSLLSAIEALVTLDGTLPVNVMFLFDGCEELGSPAIPQWLAENHEWVSRADYGFNVDAMMHSDDQGQMWKGLRGGGEVVVTVETADSDQHSGIYGGALPNAAIAASMILGSIFNDDGTIAIEDWSEGQTELSVEERAEIAEAGKAFDDAAHLEKLGTARFIGDESYSPIERTWIRSSLDVTGFKSGYLEGAASIVPHRAWFRLMIRTGPGHDTGVLIDRIEKHVEKHTPWGARVEMTTSSAGNAVLFREDDRNFAIGKTVLTEHFGKEPKILYVGGGVPALSFVPDSGGPSLVTVGFQRSDENFHADNEFMRLSSFRTGQRAYARLLHALVGQPKRDQRSAGQQAAR